MQITVDVPDHVPPAAADRDRLMQVVVNLLSNAVKFSDPERGLVEVRVRADAAGVRTDIADNGPGIAPEDQARVFEKFRQTGDAVTDRPQGTGLGLPISREIVTRLGGDIWVESSPGHGATFSFMLPVSASAVRVAEPVAGKRGGGEDPHR